MSQSLKSLPIHLVSAQTRKNNTMNIALFSMACVAIFLAATCLATTNQGTPMANPYFGWGGYPYYPPQFHNDGKGPNQYPMPFLNPPQPPQMPNFNFPWGFDGKGNNQGIQNNWPKFEMPKFTIPKVEDAHQNNFDSFFNFANLQQGNNYIPNGFFKPQAVKKQPSRDSESTDNLSGDDSYSL